MIQSNLSSVKAPNSACGVNGGCGHDVGVDLIPVEGGQRGAEI